jgi:multiple sugar transport system permease protein
MSIVAIGFTWQWMLNDRAGVFNLLPGVNASNSPRWLGDTPLGLGTLVFVQVWRTVGFCIVLYTAALSRVPKSLYEAAAVDGASNWQVMWRVTWPSVRPMTAFLFITGTIWALQVFDLDIVMNGWSPQRWNDMINTQIFREFKNGRFGYASTIGVVVLAMTAIVAAVQFRFFNGRTRGRA